ncbi:hypothetical protein [Kutzneria chonburiensis]|uniref:Uncharacterized protein n=1 Tax=Kutzneria chonburiensis TaxID=1483604 RepID=A0ABV6MHV1_9PSEU|nr:hypothetical protein [Kutzneria chonburiensis]
MNANDTRLWILISDIRTAYEKAFPTVDDRTSVIGRDATDDVTRLIGYLTKLALAADYNHFD